MVVPLRLRRRHCFRRGAYPYIGSPLINVPPVCCLA